MSWIVSQASISNLFDVFFIYYNHLDIIDKRVRRQVQSNVRAYNLKDRVTGRYFSTVTGKLVKKDLFNINSLDEVFTEEGKRKFGIDSTQFFFEGLEDEDIDVYKDHECPLCKVVHRDVSLDGLDLESFLK